MHDSKTASHDAIVVLGCPVLERGRPGAAAERRAQRAASAFHAWAASPRSETPLVIVSGGRRWHGATEADVIAARLISLGVPEGVIVREQCSLSTVENAAYSAEVLRARGKVRPGIVTCDWHASRALACFEWMGFMPTALPAVSPRQTLATTLARTVRERLGQLVDRRAARAWSAAP